MNSRPGPGPGEEAAIRRSLRFANAMSFVFSKICRHCGAPAGHSASRCPACDAPV